MIKVVHQQPLLTSMKSKHSPYSLYNGIINSSSSGSKSGGNMIISLYGYYAGYNATIICDKRCIINCYGNGCFNTYYKCTSDGDNDDDDCVVIINCDKTGEENENIDCPKNLQTVRQRKDNQGEGAFIFAFGMTDKNEYIDISQ